MNDPTQFKISPHELSGRTILITGAGGGLGSALSLECARAGATVILSGRQSKKLDRTYDDIQAIGGQAAIAPLDLATASAPDYDGLAGIIEREFGKLDGLVHAAALLGDRAPLEQYDVPTWCKVLHVDLTAPFILTQVLMPVLRKAPDASIVFVSSGVARRPRAYWGAYGVAKAGLEALSSMLAQELESIATVRANSVNPGGIRTAMRAAAYPGELPSTLRRPEEVLPVFMYLLSAASRGCTGRQFDAQPQKTAA